MGKMPKVGTKCESVLNNKSIQSQHVLFFVTKLDTVGKILKHLGNQNQRSTHVRRELDFDNSMMRWHGTAGQMYGERWSPNWTLF